MMTSRQRVLKALEFDRPDRVPRNFWHLPIARMQHGDAAIDAFQQRWPDDFTGPGVANDALRSLSRGDAHAIEG